MNGPAIEALRREALRHARQQCPAQHQDHDDAVNQALLEAVESGDYSATTIKRRVRTLLRAARPDNRRAMRCVLPESSLRHDGTGEDDSSEAPGEALDRVAAVGSVWRSAPDKPERLPPATRAIVSNLRESMQTELELFWYPHPAQPSPPWKSWARSIAAATGRAVEPERVAAAMNAGYLSPKGRQRRDFGQVVRLDGQPLPATRELATRQVGALFRCCCVDLADTQEGAKKMAVKVKRSIEKAHATSSASRLFSKVARQVGRAA